jgi:hypothetical protein
VIEFLKAASLFEVLRSLAFFELVTMLMDFTEALADMQLMTREILTSSTMRYALFLRTDFRVQSVEGIPYNQRLSSLQIQRSTPSKRHSI